jgi:hypothetical protein
MEKKSRKEKLKRKKEGKCERVEESKIIKFHRN